VEDNSKGLHNRAPMKTDQRVVLLSPSIDSWKGRQFGHMPALAGEVPANNIGLVPEHNEVPARTFRDFPEGRKSRYGVGKTGGVKELGDG